MERIWVQHYPPGVPADIDSGEFSSLLHLFERSVARCGDRVAYTCMGASLRYCEVDAAARHFAVYLHGVLRLPRGARVAIMLPNLLQYPICVLGALRAGCTVVNCNPMYTARELHHQLVDSGAEVIVILENFAHTLELARPGTALRQVVLARVGDLLGFPKGMAVNVYLKYVLRKVPDWRLDQCSLFSDCLAAGARHSCTFPELQPDDIAFLQYTGGTTGVSKGAMLTHANILANVAQTHAWVKGTLSENGEWMVCALPLYHVFAMTANFFLMLRLGASSLLIPNPRDVRGMARELARIPFSIITGVNTLFAAMLDDAAFRRLDFSHLKVSLGGGAAVQKAVAERWQALTGQPLIEAYGLTEASPGVAMNPFSVTVFSGSIGLPLPSTEVVLRADDGTDVPLGTPGELCVRGPQVMRGYYGQREETARVFCADGFLRTGDLGVMDERGEIRLIDRKKDLILVSGFNVYPGEVEAVVCQHPGVAEAAAVGVPDARTGEAVKLYVVRRDPELDADALRALCRQQLTRYKVPGEIEFRDALPKTPVGKILRRALRDE